MPHLRLEYTSNLSYCDWKAALLRLNAALTETGHVDEIDIKSRARAVDHFVIGTSAEKRGFVHVTLLLMSGRSTEIKSSLSQILLEELRDIFPGSPETHVQLCVEVVDIDRDTYAKAVIPPLSR
jgi:5-carboxymethyl-2-hydroxymuconate isomerase